MRRIQRRRGPALLGACGRAWPQPTWKDSRWPLSASSRRGGVAKPSLSMPCGRGGKEGVMSGGACSAGVRWQRCRVQLDHALRPPHAHPLPSVRGACVTLIPARCASLPPLPCGASLSCPARAAGPTIHPPLQLHATHPATRLHAPVFLHAALHVEQVRTQMWGWGLGAPMAGNGLRLHACVRGAGRRRRKRARVAPAAHAYVAASWQGDNKAWGRHGPGAPRRAAAAASSGRERTASPASKGRPPLPPLWAIRLLYMRSKILAWSPAASAASPDELSGGRLSARPKLSYGPNWQCCTESSRITRTT